MKIAIATNDRKTIAKRTGRAAEFAFYQIENGKISTVTYQKNTHEHHDHDRRDGHHRQGHGEGHGHGHGHGHGEGAHSHDEIVPQLKDVDIFLVRAVGQFMKKDLENGKIPYQLVKGENLEEIISNYLKNQL
jgi:predicted Fe-Mo cluster-binding NifX family protein